MLELLTGLNIINERDVDRAAATYIAASPLQDEPKDLKSLQDAGWISVVWGKVRPIKKYQIISRANNPKPKSTYDGWAGKLHRKEFKYVKRLPRNSRLKEILKKVKSNELEPRELVCLTPSWVAARLWEIISQSNPNKASALRDWVDKWNILHSPAFAPHKYLSNDTANEFCTEVISAIDKIVSSNENDARQYIISQTVTHEDVLIEDVAIRVAPWPPSLVGRALWFETPIVEATIINTGYAYHEISNITRLLFEDVIWAEYSTAPHPIAKKLIEQATIYPELLYSVIGRARQKPILIADLILYPASSALACLLIAQWQGPGGASDRGLIDQDERASRLDVFLDAIEILGKYLDAGEVSPVEPGALLRWFHRRSYLVPENQLADHTAMLEVFRREMANRSQSVLKAISDSLLGAGFEQGLGSPEFSAFINIVAIGEIDQLVSPDIIINSYANSVNRGEYSLSAYGIGIKEAWVLAKISMSNAELRARFLRPMHVKQRLISSTEENPYTLADEIVRSLRAHIRILSRAIAGTQGTVQTDIVDALVDFIRAGSFDHREKGKVAAFAPRFEQPLMRAIREQPLAADLGAGLTRLEEKDRTKLLNAILETDEPIILAQLINFCPSKCAAAIHKRINEITPSDAAEIRSLPEMQSRINELIKIGAADAAERYITIEETLQTFGKVPHRELARFQNQLQISFIKKDWQSIIDAQLPPDLETKYDRDTAEESLSFFRALVALKGPNPNPAAARDIFYVLFTKKPKAAYVTNWFAAEIGRLLQSDTFGILEGQSLREARHALAELDRMLARSALYSEENSEITDCNRVVLLLSIGETQQALSVLNTKLSNLSRDNVAAYRAIALFRQDRRDDAIATIDTAEQVFGLTPVLEAAKSHVIGGYDIELAVNVSVNESDIAILAASILRFKQLDAAMQADVISNGRNPLESLIISYVRSASGSVVSLIPMMKNVTIDKIEDDITAFVHHILSALVRFHGWSVSDQSKGGFTGRGNPGERDLAIKQGEDILAILEAIKIERPVANFEVQKDLEVHFQKLFAYASCPLFFHITYSYNQNVQDVMSYLKSIAELASPPNYKYRIIEEIRHSDSRPTGFIARYNVERGEVVVVFLVLDMGQRTQREAAITADKTKSRKAPKARSPRSKIIK